MGFLSGLAELLFPPKCMFCRRVLPGGRTGYCKTCEETLIRPRPNVEGASFRLCCVALPYEGNVRDALTRFKFGDKPGYASELGKILAGTVRRELEGLYDLISWVPVSRERLEKRGYDQAGLLAMATALELQDVAVETLTKSRDNPAQSGLDTPEERKTNVKNVYRAVDLELIREKRILLIDDIITTGATLDEASRVLLNAGARSVVCAALARPVKKKTDSKEDKL